MMSTIRYGALAALVMILAVACSTRTSRTSTSVPAAPVQTTTAEPGVIPVGTAFAVRTNETISSEQMKQTYSAQVEQDIMDQSGRILVPKGSPAELGILATTEGGVGTPSMELVIRSVTVNGRRFAIQTAAEVQEGEQGLGANRRTAETVGGGAALGTLIGAIAGGGKGAVIGAAAGAAGGAAVQVLTRGDKVEVPAESVLTFRLGEPWRLSGF